MFGGSPTFAETVSVESPDGQLKLIFDIASDGGVMHALAFDDKPLISPSPQNSVWKPDWGKRWWCPRTK